MGKNKLSALSIYSPIVHHQFLHCQEGFVSHIGIRMAQQLHHSLFPTQRFNDTENHKIQRYSNDINKHFILRYLLFASGIMSYILSDVETGYTYEQGILAGLQQVN